LQKANETEETETIYSSIVTWDTDVFQQNTLVWICQLSNSGLRRRIQN